MTAAQHFEPVWIWERPGSRRAIGSVRAAAEWLLFFWPEAFTQTEANRIARQACLDAHDGKADVAAAREAFRVAAEEAGIWASDPREDFPTAAAARPGKRRR